MKNVVTDAEQPKNKNTLKIADRFAVLSFTATLNEDDIMRNKKWLRPIQRKKHSLIHSMKENQNRRKTILKISHIKSRQFIENGIQSK